MNYTLHQLHVFLKVAQTLSITKAAEELYLTQPAVSIQLKNFQDQFEIPLTEIVGRKLYLTDFGKEIAIAAQNILNEVNTINHKTLAYKGQLFGKLKISVVSTGKYVMPYFLSGFMQHNSGVELQMDVTNKSKVVEALSTNQTDFALVSVIPDHLKLDKIELMQNKLFLIGSKTFKFPQKVHDKKIINDLPLIYREEGSGTRYVMEKFIERNQLKVKKTMELTSNEAVKQAVIAGLGFSIMPLIGLKNELNNKDVQIIKVANFPIKSTWHLVWLTEKKLSPIAIAYLEYLKKEKNNVIKKSFSWFENY